MKIKKKTITEHINTDYKDYTIYVLEERGIPNFYDSITPVHRYIIQNAPRVFTKTISVVGECIKDGYHHGDKSLSDSINNITREYLCSDQILEGDGFFGNPINSEPSAARYTSVRINKDTKEIIKEEIHLFSVTFNNNIRII